LPLRFDGRIFPVSALDNRRKAKADELPLEDRWYPIQVKQTAKAGRPDIDAFEAMMAREECAKGVVFVSFGYTGDAYRGPALTPRPRIAAWPLPASRCSRRAARVECDPRFPILHGGFRDIRHSKLRLHERSSCHPDFGEIGAHQQRELLLRGRSG
jgi:hypothetical protein